MFQLPQNFSSSRNRAEDVLPGWTRFNTKVLAFDGGGLRGLFQGLRRLCPLSLLRFVILNNICTYCVDRPVASSDKSHTLVNSSTNYCALNVIYSVKSPIRWRNVNVKIHFMRSNRCAQIGDPHATTTRVRQLAAARFF